MNFERAPFWELCHAQLSLSLDLYIWPQAPKKLQVPLKHANHYTKWFYVFLYFALLKFFLQITKISLAEITLPLLMNSSASCSLEKPASTSTLTISHVDPAATCFCCVENLYIWWNSENSGLCTNLLDMFVQIPSCRPLSDMLYNLANFLLDHGIWHFGTVQPTDR